jgi:spore germination cell wall hydrolase CwlJ-like protein
MYIKTTQILSGLLMILLVQGCSNILPAGFTITDSFSAPSVLQYNAGTRENLSDTTTTRFSSRDKECLVRVMYFESNRSSETGMLAVGTVVMNRVASSRFPNSVCAVVTAPRQFAPGVMSRTMSETRPVALASSVADRVMRGERHSGVRTAKFFHQAGLKFPYTNMHYVVNAGGNAFYIKS